MCLCLQTKLEQHCAALQHYSAVIFQLEHCIECELNAQTYSTIFGNDGNGFLLGARRTRTITVPIICEHECFVSSIPPRLHAAKNFFKKYHFSQVFNYRKEIMRKHCNVSIRPQILMDIRSENFDFPHENFIF